jgi:deoxycytidine triphosphate deaminase
LFGAFIVIGHNVFHIVPNEVIVLSVLVLISIPAYWIGIVLVSILFGYGHFYKGPSGVIDSGFAGLILGTAFMPAGHNSLGLHPRSRIY